MKKFTKAMSVIAIASLLGLVGVQTALATPTPGTLADENQIFVMQYDSNVSADLVTIDPSTGLTAQVGSSALDEGWSGASFNPADGQIYAINLHEWADPYTLYSFDPSTGEATVIGNLPDGVSAGALAIDADGNGYLIDWDQNLYSIDLATAQTTLIGTLSASAGADIYSFAINPVDGRAYAIEFYGTGDLLEIDLENATSTVVVSHLDSLLGYFVCALTFDSNGTAWFQVEQNVAELWSADINDFVETAQFETQYFNPDDASDAFYTEALAVTYPVGAASSGHDELAATGVPADLVVGATAIAGLAVLTGARLVVRRRRSEQN